MLQPPDIRNRLATQQPVVPSLPSGRTQSPSPRAGVELRPAQTLTGSGTVLSQRGGRGIDETLQGSLAGTTLGFEGEVNQLYLQLQATEARREEILQLMDPHRLARA